MIDRIIRDIQNNFEQTRSAKDNIPVDLIHAVALVNEKVAELNKTVVTEMCNSERPRDDIRTKAIEAVSTLLSLIYVYQSNENAFDGIDDAIADSTEQITANQPDELVLKLSTSGTIAEHIAKADRTDLIHVNVRYDDFSLVASKNTTNENMRCIWIEDEIIIRRELELIGKKGYQLVDLCLIPDPEKPQWQLTFFDEQYIKTFQLDPPLQDIDFNKNLYIRVNEVTEKWLKEMAVYELKVYRHDILPHLLSVRTKNALVPVSCDFNLKEMLPDIFELAEKHEYTLISAHLSKLKGNIYWKLTFASYASFDYN